MWKTVENSIDEKPLAIDETSSQSKVYVRKDFEEIPNYNSDGEEIGTHWRYSENEINKEDWETYKTLLSTQDDITDIQIALV